MIGKTVIVWLMPGAVALTTVAGNVWMALVYATVLARLGLLDASTPLGWLPFFALLGANNMLALGVFFSWLRSHEREQAARAEILAAVKWRNHPTAIAAKAEGFAPPRHNFSITSRQLSYCLSFGAALCAPAALLGAAILG